MTNDLDTLLIALYVEIDDHVALPARSGRGQPKRLTDAELICLAAQVLLGDLERHGGRTTEGLYARIAQRLLAMATCIWHNWADSTPVTRSLIAYDH